MLSVLQLGLVLSVLVLQSVFFGFNKVFVVATVTVQPLGVQVDDVCYHGVEEVPVVGDDQDGGLPRLWEQVLVMTGLLLANCYHCFQRGMLALK